MAGRNPLAASVTHASSEHSGQHRRAPSVGALCERFFDTHVLENCKPTTQAEYRRAINKFIKPAIGAFRVVDVERKDIAELHNKHRPVPYQANRTLGVLSKMFNLAEVWGLRPDGSNPCRHVPKYREKKRERFLSQGELQRLGQVLTDVEAEGSETPFIVAAFRLLILTGCRLGEIQTLKWTYVTLRHMELPDTKTGARRIPLCNPPFHSSMEQANKGTLRKWANLGKGHSKKLNFGGQNAELWCPGGEIKFIARMVEQSMDFADQCLWFPKFIS